MSSAEPSAAGHATQLRLRQNYATVILDGVSATNYLLPLLAAGGTVAAAIVTGFGAAALKHKWDTEAEDLRWERECRERRRAELRLSLARYLVQRSVVQSTMSRTAMAGRTQDDVNRSAEAVSEYSVALTDLRIILDADAVQALAPEMTALSKWLKESTSRVHQPGAALAPPPDDQGIVAIARKFFEDR